MLLVHISPRLTRSTQAQNSDTGSVRQNTPVAPERNEAMTSFPKSAADVEICWMPLPELIPQKYLAD